MFLIMNKPGNFNLIKTPVMLVLKLRQNCAQKMDATCQSLRDDLEKTLKG